MQARHVDVRALPYFRANYDVAVVKSGEEAARIEPSRFSGGGGTLYGLSNITLTAQFLMPPDILEYDGVAARGAVAHFYRLPYPRRLSHFEFSTSGREKFHGAIYCLVPVGVFNHDIILLRSFL